jgi:hypothetical protein
MKKVQVALESAYCELHFPSRYEILPERKTLSLSHKCFFLYKLSPVLNVVVINWVDVVSQLAVCVCVCAPLSLSLSLSLSIQSLCYW